MSLANVDFYTRFAQKYFAQKEGRADAAGFLAFFGKGGEDSTVFAPSTGVVDIDIQKSTGQTLARMVNRGSQFTPTDVPIQGADDYSSQSFEFGMIEDESKLTSNQLIKRLAGEMPYEGATLSERRHSLAMKMHMKSLGKVFRTHSLLASQSVLTGKHDQIIGTSNTDKIYDFRRASTATVTPSNTWDSGSQTILADIDAGCDFVLSTGYAMPDMMVMGQGMLDAFLRDSDVKSILESQNGAIQLIRVSMDNPVPPGYERFVKAGFVPFGRLRTTRGYNLWMFTLPHNYLDLSGSSQKYMPEDKVLIASSKGRCDRYFGPRDSFELTGVERQWYQDMFGINAGAGPLPMELSENQMDGAIYDPRSFYADAYPLGDRKGVIMRVQSAPIYATTDTDVYYTIENGLT